MSNQFGLLHVWSQGDWVTRGVFAALILMSLASWIVIAIKALDVVRAKRQAARVEGFWHSSDMAEGLSKLGDGDANPFRQLAIGGREAAAHHRATRAQLHDSLDVSDWISRALRNRMDSTTGKLQAGLAILASVGSTAPFVGLFGTVWGIYHALMKIGAAGQAGIDQVAGPIGEALIMTALGLAVAIPAVLGYNALVRGNKHILAKLGRFAHELHAYYVTGARVTAASDGNVVSLKRG
ncbi:MotA/TolQ/ExbB proton channel family protein [Ottowia sp.]|uniref:MotA/TolQ/ExbB proton channel family protein n=1 Tax=Ottowia sp. TaxID=1898956 RepID=UPI002C8FEFB3|nr:MotA/TolQ/ExbB proton channel family protein [Ottowia sp.]HOB66845.1 MotA/TolQ/ExbB proton channel family protein [Ottowia sp.]HPZ55887.1 MotA/TolQ/ExbB proton channel family protein [Ottowia sp.]HQD47989.1 MotA/TolQ/ExbB proton channel family protein [Ottowia sp.]